MTSHRRGLLHVRFGSQNPTVTHLAVLAVESALAT